MTRQEKHNRNLLISLLVLGVATIGYYWYSSTERSAIDPGMFQVTDWKAINRVMLKSAQSTLDIHFDGIRWRVNDAVADPDMIDVLFATLQQSRPLRPVAESLSDSIAQYVINTGVQVSVFADQQQQLIFRAGGNSRKTQAYFLEEETNQPYLVTIPGYRVYVSGIFELNESGWKDKYVFQLNWRNFSHLTVEFPGLPAEAYSARMINDYFAIEGLPRTDTTRLNDFIDALSLLTVSKYEDDLQLAVQLSSLQPGILYSVFDVGGKVFTLALYPEAAAGDQVPGLINAKQPAYFSRNQLGPLLQKRAYFAGKD
jgi:hypothetical protein